MGLVIFWTEVLHGLVFTDQPGPALDVSEQDQRNGGTVQPMTRRNDDLEVIPVTAFENIVSDCELVEQVMTRGKSEFARSCARCHGADGTGGIGYLNLTDSDWLWGGSLDAIETTIRYGIRAEHEDTRYTEMPAFLTEGILTLSEIDSIATHVLSLSGGGTDRAANSIGAELFVQNCAICHGPQGQGDPKIGVPRLNDEIWLYGADIATVVETISFARNATMPYWVDELDGATIRLLAVYVRLLGERDSRGASPSCERTG